MSLGVFELRRLLVRQWTSRPGRALATIASVAVAVGAVVATWVSADASRAGYKSLTSAIEGVSAVDILSKSGGRFEASDLPSLANLPGVRAVVPLFYRPTLLRVGEKRVREIAVGVDAERLVEQLRQTGTLPRARHSARQCGRGRGRGRGRLVVAAAVPLCADGFADVCH